MGRSTNSVAITYLYILCQIIAKNAKMTLKHIFGNITPVKAKSCNIIHVPKWREKWQFMTPPRDWLQRGIPAIWRGSSGGTWITYMAADQSRTVNTNIAWIWKTDGESRHAVYEGFKISSRGGRISTQCLQLQGRCRGRISVITASTCRSRHGTDTETAVPGSTVQRSVRGPGGTRAAAASSRTWTAATWEGAWITTGLGFIGTTGRGKSP